MSIVEGDDGTNDAALTVYLSAPSGLLTSIDFATADAMATAGSDCQSVTGSLTFAPGETTKTISMIEPDLAPVVTDVFVNGTGWAMVFRSYFGSSGAGDATYGFRLDAAGHVDELPWTGLNRVSIRFSEDVGVTADDLVIRGVNLTAFSGLTMTYDAASHTATFARLTTAKPVFASSPAVRSAMRLLAQRFDLLGDPLEAPLVA
jgi:hypothetical protein